MALLEILMATRSDPELGRRFPPVAREIAIVQQRAMWMLAKAAGINDREAVRRMTDMMLATMRGLSIQLLFVEDDAAIEKAMALAIEWKSRWFATMVPDA